jgi:O-antigen ligase
MTLINQFKQGNYAVLIFLLCSAACFPLFSLIVKGWVSGVLFFSTLIAVILLLLPFYKHPPEGLRTQSDIFTTDPLGRLSTFFVIAFSLPILSVALGQLLQGSLNVARFDAPSRYLFAVVVFMAITRYRSSVPRVLELAVPAASVITLALISFVPVTFWSAYPGRLSNHFIDPLIFGQIALALGVISLLMMRFNEKRVSFITLLQLIGAIAGIYLSIRSGSRTGWLGIPLLVFFWVMHYSMLSRWKTALLAVTAVGLLMSALYFGSSGMRPRLNDMYLETINYHWNKMNPDTNVGVRISWMRIGWHFFSIHPLSGWGDQSLEKNINDEAIAVYASKASRDGILIAGFHNDFVANAVRYGIGGFIATVGIFLIPLLFFTYCLRYKKVESYAMAGFGYVLIQSASSLSYHVLDFKFVASFYALMVSVLLGVIVNKMKT